jgi:AcrR family transcriptional regulator
VDLSDLSNKEKIFQVAIRLFAMKGYHNVSMRELAKEVQIKAASIYNHYASKEALLASIVDYFCKELQKEVYHSYVTAQNLNAIEFIKRTTEANNLFFSTPIITEISTIIFREQFQSEKIRSMLLEELIRKPRGIYTTCFERLINSGHLREMDPAMLAVEYHSYFIYRFYENALALDFSQINSIKLKEEQEEHIRIFLKNYSLD